MAVNEAIQSGETESIGSPKDILSGVVASRCPSLCSSHCTRGAHRRVCKSAKRFVRPPNFYSQLTHFKASPQLSPDGNLKTQNPQN